MPLCDAAWKRITDHPVTTKWAIRCALAGAVLWLLWLLFSLGKAQLQQITGDAQALVGLLGTVGGLFGAIAGIVTAASPVLALMKDKPKEGK